MDKILNVENSRVDHHFVSCIQLTNFDLNHSRLTDEQELLKIW